MNEIFFEQKANKEGTDFEKKHAPIVELLGAAKKGEWVKVKVRMSDEVPHPNELGHYISSITLLFNSVALTHAEFQPEGAAAVVVFKVKFDTPGTLKAIARCNLHGDWAGTLDVKL